MIVATSDPSQRRAKLISLKALSLPHQSLRDCHYLQITRGGEGFHHACTRKEDKKPGKTDVEKVVRPFCCSTCVVTATPSAVTRQHKLELDLIRKWSNFSFSSVTTRLRLTLRFSMLLVRGPHGDRPMSEELSNLTKKCFFVFFTYICYNQRLINLLALLIGIFYCPVHLN